MAQRYVRVQTPEGQVYYGLLQVDRQVEVLDAPPWLQGQPTNQQLSPGGYRLLAPCAPSKIVAVAKNYGSPGAATEYPPPQEPLIFIKPPTTVLPFGGAIEYPPQSQHVDCQGELALVIGDRCTNASQEVAQGKIWGYTIANDVTARDLQERDGQWTRAKGFDTFCPLGPWIVRELSPGAYLKTFVNDDREPVQSASTDEMIYSAEAITAYISQIMTLVPGDVILTGAPPGVGLLQVGDRVAIEIEGIGSLENTIVPRPSVS